MRTMSGVWVSIAAFFAVSVGAQETGEGDAAADPAASAETIVLDPNAPPSTRPGCLSIRRVRNFSGLTNELVYVEEAGNSHFLLTMFRSCPGLRNARTIAIENHRDRVCSDSQAEITFRGVGGRPESCQIRTVEAVEDRDAARALAELRAPGR